MPPSTTSSTPQDASHPLPIKVRWRAADDSVAATTDNLFVVVFSGDGDLEREGLKLIGSLSLLSEDVLWSMGGLPNHIFPSDHLSLLAKFQLELNVP